MSAGADSAEHRDKLRVIARELMPSAGVAIDDDACDAIFEQAKLLAREALGRANDRAQARHASAEDGEEEEVWEITISDLRPYIVDEIGEDACGFDEEELEVVRESEFEAGVTKFHLARLAARDAAIALQNRPTVSLAF